jgi:hypothetical protein
MIALGATFLLAACTQSDDLAPQPITLTTPVVTIDAMADTRSASTPGMQYAILYLNLLDEDAQPQAQTAFAYNGSAWSLFDDAITVTAGAGDYRASTYMSANLAEVPGTRPTITDILDAYTGYIGVEEDGTFAFGSALKPATAAIHLTLKDADGQVISTDTPGQDIEVKWSVLKQVSDITALNEARPQPQNPVVSTDDSFVRTDGGTRYASIGGSQSIGCFVPSTYGTAGQGFDLFSIKRTDASGTLKGIWSVGYPDALTLEAGKLYRFTATLGRDATLTTDNITIAPWDEKPGLDIGK